MQTTLIQNGESKRGVDLLPSSPSTRVLVYNTQIDTITEDDIDNKWNTGGQIDQRMSGRYRIPWYIGPCCGATCSNWNDSEGDTKHDTSLIINSVF